MKRIAILFMVGVLVPAAGHAQSSAKVQEGAATQSQAGVNVNTQKPSAQASGNGSASAQTQAGQNAVALSDGTTMNAALASSVDVKKNKLGDRIEARTTQDVKQDGKVVLRKGTRLVGHVTEVQSRAKDQTQSQLGVAFDHAELRNGQQVPLNASIQALAAAQSTAQASAGDDDLIASGGGAASAGAGAARGGALVGGTLRNTGSTVSSVGTGVGSTANGAVGGAVNAATHTTGAVGGLNASGALQSNSKGVFGLEGLSLNSAASSATQGSLIVSSTRNIHLESGTQMVLQVAGRAQ
jgi:hypothetical protein